MTAAKTVPAGKTWTQPELVKLGKIADVAGPGPNPIQNANNS